VTKGPVRWDRGRGGQGEGGEGRGDLEGVEIGWEWGDERRGERVPVPGGGALVLLATLPVWVEGHGSDAQDRSLKFSRKLNQVVNKRKKRLPRRHRTRRNFHA